MHFPIVLIKMGNWYKIANNDMLMARDIATWLQQAANGNVDILTMQDDMTMRMGNIDDSEMLDGAISMASNWVAQQQGGTLFPVQQEMIASLYSRIQPTPAVDEPPPDPDFG